MKRCYHCMKEYSDTYEMCPYCGHTQDEPQEYEYFLKQGTMVQGRYEIGDSAGSGGFGITYRAWDHSLQKVVAVKEYYPAGLVNRIPGEKEVIVYSGNSEKECMNGKIRFLEEARNMAKFNTHPNIVNVYDFFEENNTAYIIMEFLEGITYKEYIKEQGGRVDPNKALEITDAVLTALQEVHSNGILHRDISPDNVFLCSDGKIKLIDFGAARFSSLESERTRSVILKPGFAPPEQYQTKSKQGPWTDIYAVGAMLYRAITGNLPEESVNRAEEDLLTEPIKFCPIITENLNSTILRSMSLLPELRFQTVKEFMDALHSTRGVRDVKEELRMRKRRRFFFFSSVAIVVAVATLVCFKVLKQKKRSAGVLETAAVSIWLCSEPGEEANTIAMYENALSEFMKEYPQITLDIQCFSTEEYAKQVKNASKKGELPTLLDSTDLKEEYLSYFSDLSDVLDFVEVSEYYFIDKLAKYYPEKKQIPLSFHAPLLYYNTIIAGDDATVDGLLGTDQLKYDIQNYFTFHNLRFEDDAWNGIDSLPDTAPEGLADACEQDETLFLAGNLTCYLSDTSIYSTVELKMPGCFRVENLSGAGVFGRFDHCYSIAKGAGEEERDAAIQILVFLLAESGQDVLNVQNNNGLPLNKRMFETYIEVNPQLAGISKGLKDMKFCGEDQVQADAWAENNLVR